eukprot:scaffold1534_cov122-Isochrysis_galbana.AAC.9
MPPAGAHQRHGWAMLRRAWANGANATVQAGLHLALNSAHRGLDSLAKLHLPALDAGFVPLLPAPPLHQHVSPRHKVLAIPHPPTYLTLRGPVLAGQAICAPRVHHLMSLRVSGVHGLPVNLPRLYGRLQPVDARNLLALLTRAGDRICQRPPDAQWSLLVLPAWLAPPA